MYAGQKFKVIHTFINSSYFKKAYDQGTIASAKNEFTVNKLWVIVIMIAQKAQSR